MLKNIPQSRLLIYLLILGMFPLLIVILMGINQKSTTANLLDRLYSVQTQAYIHEKRQAINGAVIDHYREADKFYIDKHLENISFLRPEIEGLLKVVQNKNFAGDEFINKRLEFLQSKENKMLFTEGPAEVYPLFQESIASLARPVQLNLADLKKVLSLIEGVDIGEDKPSPGRPQMIITDFSLAKQLINEGNEVLSMNMKVLKREYQ